MPDLKFKENNSGSTASLRRLSFPGNTISEALKKMKIKWLLSVVFVVSVLAASAGGFWYGYRLAVNVTVNDWAIEQAHDVQGHLKTLRLLRNNKTPEALESLESRLDNDLAILEPEAPAITLEPGVRKQVDKAFLDARNYRTENPRAPSKAVVQ